MVRSVNPLFVGPVTKERVVGMYGFRTVQAGAVSYFKYHGKYEAGRARKTFTKAQNCYRIPSNKTLDAIVDATLKGADNYGG